ncbi:MAG: ROK family protein [Bacteroidetes bacterium]|nr:ROK family protein [Bacteroidota bacterium]
MQSTKNLVIGIDIGGTNTVFGLVNKDGKILSRGTISTTTTSEVNEYIDLLYNAVQPEIMKMGGPEMFCGIGIGAPNGNFYKGTIEYAPNLKWQKGIIPFASLMEQKFGIPSYLTNDANAAAIGEMKYGAAKNMKDFIMITLGTGVGSGIVANGSLIYGHDGFAGEMGHMTVLPGGRKHWSTGAFGPLEAYASATGVRLTAIEFLASGKFKGSLLEKHPNEEINSKLIFEYAEKGDVLCLEVFRVTGEILGLALANAVMFSSPEAIFLFGGLCDAGDMLMKPVKESMEKNLIPVFQNKVHLIFSELKQSDAAILGASALAW